MDAVVLTDGTAEVYNLTVDEAHTYFVGDGAWLVHNACRIPKENPHHIGGNKALERYDALKNGILTPSEMQKHMVAAEAEAMGQPTIFKSGGDPYDHAHELRGHYNALVNIIKALKRVTYRPTGLSPELEQELKGIITEVEGHRQALETFLKKIKRFRK